MDAIVWRIGDVSITRIPEVVVDMPLTGLLPDATAAALQRYRGWLEPHFVRADGSAPLSIHGLVVHADGLRILVDSPSLPYVRGAIVDYVESMQGAGFKVDNPNVIAACGCGSSFRVAEEEEVSAV